MRRWLGRQRRNLSLLAGLMRVLGKAARSHLLLRAELLSAEWQIAQLTGELELLRSIVDAESPGLSERIADTVRTLNEIQSTGDHDHE